MNRPINYIPAFGDFFHDGSNNLVDFNPYKCECNPIERIEGNVKPTIMHKSNNKISVIYQLIPLILIIKLSTVVFK